MQFSLKIYQKSLSKTNKVINEDAINETPNDSLHNPLNFYHKSQTTD